MVGLMKKFERALARSAPGLVLTLAMAVVAGGGCRAPSARPRGIILISVDTLRADRVNAYGYTRRRVSPNIDALARDGVLFDSHIASAPWTTPSHMSIFTARYPTAHGITMPVTRLENALKLGQGYPQLSGEIPTFPELLQRAGWSTAAFTGGRTVDPRIGFGRGFERYGGSMVKLNQRKMRRMLAWLERQEGRPFFLFWHTFEVHAPYLRGRFLDEVLPHEQAERLRRRLTRILRRPGWKSVHTGRAALEDLDAFTLPVCDALYDGGIETFDGYLGTLIGWLRERGLYDKVAILLTSDHGEQLGERDGVFYDRHGYTVYEEMVRTPLIIKLPGGRHAGDLTVSAVSPAPTLAAMERLSFPPSIAMPRKIRMSRRATAAS